MKDIKELKMLIDNKTNLACACVLFSTATNALVQAQFYLADMYETEGCTKGNMQTYRNLAWDTSDELKTVIEELVDIQKELRAAIEKE